MSQVFKQVCFNNIKRFNSTLCNSSFVNNKNKFISDGIIYRQFSSSNNDDKVTFTFINKDGSKTKVTEEVGKNILEAAHDNDVDLEGACECSCACSTCHVYLEPKIYNILPEPTDEENDMLDLAFQLKENSRLGCQIKLTKELEGMEVTLPSASRNMTVDGYKPPKH
ncbi:hypothetical protein RB653_007931 [Dictyostelium firmibasis]|uniref:2Fe-2S ferredoxin-type domain-containing protein n=1 Tax=Dictyostelium firmibasis TaxID=79012 RepID=A0AAN7YV33_9MYCE